MCKYSVWVIKWSIVALTSEFPLFAAISMHLSRKTGCNKMISDMDYSLSHRSVTGASWGYTDTWKEIKEKMKIGEVALTVTRNTWQRSKEHCMTLHAAKGTAGSGLYSSPGFSPWQGEGPGKKVEVTHHSSWSKVINISLEICEALLFFLDF